MRSPITALTWEIFRRGRLSAGLSIASVTLAVLLNLLVPQNLRVTAASQEVFNGVFGMLMVASFILMMGTFNYTETSPAREWNGFPYRLFTLPVRTWQLVALPMFLSVVFTELIYLAWIKFVWTTNPFPTPEWFAVILGAWIIFYQTAVWSFAGFRVLRILGLGFGGTGAVLVAFLPKMNGLGVFESSPWLTENHLAPIIIMAAAVAFLIAVNAIGRQRSGGGVRRNWLIALFDRLNDALPRRRANFASPTAAQFWFEWRRAGILLPACTALVLIAILAPYSWVLRHDSKATTGILIRIVIAPLVLSFAVGQFFIRPDVWIASAAFPSFLAIRPLPTGDFVISKLKVAALSVIITWLLVFGFIALWLSCWADATKLKQYFGLFRYSLSPNTWPLILAAAAVILMTLSWRCLVSDLWLGLCGPERWAVAVVFAQYLAPIILLVTAVIFSNKIDFLIRHHSRHQTDLAIAIAGWLLAILVIAKISAAACAWSKLNPRRAFQYLLIWSAVTTGFIAFAGVPPWYPDTYRLEHLCILATLLLFPFARIGFVPLLFSKNRHR